MDINSNAAVDGDVGNRKRNRPIDNGDKRRKTQRVSKPVLKENKIAMEMDLRDYAGFTKDVGDYFKALYAGKDIPLCQLASLRFKISMLLWRIDGDYETKKMLDYSKQLKPVQISSSTSSSTSRSPFLSPHKDLNDFDF